MSYLRIFQVDAFTDRLFGGNPAAVVPLEDWLPDELMQKIAAENNLSETAFIVEEAAGYRIRWFTPGAEVPLCGHATLATAFVLFQHYLPDHESVEFQSASGPLSVTRRADGWLEMNFPNLAFNSVEEWPALLSEGLGIGPKPCFHVPNDTNYMVILDSEADVLAIEPDLRALTRLGNQGVIVTAPGNDSDFVSRYFAPGVGVDEDPVTGSIHSVLTPYWAERLGRQTLLARQLSSRGGVLKCELRGERVAIAGQAVAYMDGRLTL
ncbi:PhzF family phenazine biosynthesis protein [Marinobacteraceae bacterium S3BR75-40.1]